MKIEQTGSTELTITDNIKSIEDSTLIKNAIKFLVDGGSKRIHLRIQNSFSMTSAVIGYLMKVVHHDKVQLSVAIDDQRLYSLLESLNLIDVFGVRLAETPKG